jgi:hypothetical protein
VGLHLRRLFCYGAALTKTREMSLSVWPVCVIGRVHVVRRACGGHRFVAPHIFVAFGVAQTFMTRAARCCGGLYSSCTPVEIHHTTTSLFSLLAALLPMQRRPAWLRWHNESRSRDGQLGHWAFHESLHPCLGPQLHSLGWLHMV